MPILSEIATRRWKRLRIRRCLDGHLLLKAFGRPSGLFWDRHHPCSDKVVKRGFVVQTHYFLFLCREWSWHIVCEGGVAYKNSGLSLRDEWYNSNQFIHLDLIIIFLTLSFWVTCTSVEGHWGEMGQLTCRVHGSTNLEQLSSFWGHVIDLWFGIQQSHIWSMLKCSQCFLGAWNLDCSHYS